MDYLYSLYDALISINVPSDKARAVVDAMERDMGTTLATKTDLLLLRQEIENRFDLTSRDIDSLRKDVESLRTSTTKELESSRVSVGKEIEAFRASIGKEIESFRVSIGKEIESSRVSTGKDLEALRLSMTVRLGSIVMVGVGVILAAIRLWA